MNAERRMQNEERRKLASVSKFFILHSAFCIQKKGSAFALPFQSP